MSRNRNRPAGMPALMLLSAMLAFLVVAPSGAAAQQAVIYDLTVTGPDGKAIPGATVTVTSAAGKKSAIATAGNGAAKVVLPSGNNKIEVTAPGFAPASFMAGATEERNANKKTVVLARAAAPATPAPAKPATATPATPPAAKPAAPPAPQPQMTQAQRKAACEQKRQTCMKDWAQKNAQGVPVTPPDKTKMCWDNYYACEKGS